MAALIDEPTRSIAVAQGRILVVDDEAMVTEVVARYLEREGFAVDVAADGEQALQLARTQQPDLIVLDLMLPKQDGLEVCRALRHESEVPVIMLTAKGEEMDRIIGLELGADDYVVKPFSPRELLARVKAVLRRGATRTQPAEAGDALRFGDLRINPKTRVVEARAQRIGLTAKEFDLLYFLASSPGQVFTRDQLMNQVWDFAYAGDASTVTVHIRRLREKIEADPERPAFLKTVWGVGYKFEGERGPA